MKLQLQKTKLPNGLQVATSSLPHVSSVAMGVWVGVGGRYESARLSGASHFIEHLLFKGTRTRSARQISQAIEGRGGYFNAFTQEESTCYYARVDAEHAKRVLTILMDMYRHPKFAADDIRKERGVIIEEIMMYQDQPQHLVQDILGQLLWSGHAMGRPLIGTPQTVGGMTRSDLLGFKNKKYVPGNTVVSFAGKLEHERCVDAVAEALGDMKNGREPICSKVTAKTRQQMMGMLEKSIEQCHLAMGFRTFGRLSPRKYALKLLSVILGENMSSRLFQVVREKHGLAYSIHSSVQLYQDTGVFDIQAGIDKRSVHKAVALVVRELRRVKQAPVSARELRRAKDYIIGQIKIGLETTTSQMMWAGEHLLYYDSFVQPDSIIKRIEVVTAEDVMKIACDVLKPGRVSISVVSPGVTDQDRQRMEQVVCSL